MLRRPAPLHLGVALFLAFACQAKLHSAQPEKATPASGIRRMEGVDPSSSIGWVRLILEGKPVKGPAALPGPPLLIAQCTLAPTSKYRFEMFASFGDATDLAFYPPWKRTTQQDLFPPRTDKYTLTMEFLGYTHVKPLHRQWEMPIEAPGLYRYNSPGSGSSNMEDIASDLRYLLALPTLRLSLADRTAEFVTTPLLVAIQHEPLCRAASL